MTELIRASEAAKRLGVSRTVIYRLIDRGVLPTTKIADFILVDVDDLKKVDVTDRKNGRPSKKEGLVK